MLMFTKIKVKSSRAVIFYGHPRIIAYKRSPTPPPTLPGLQHFKPNKTYSSKVYVSPRLTPVKSPSSVFDLNQFGVIIYMHFERLQS